MAESSGTQAVDRALQLLTSVLQAPDPVSYGQLQLESELTKSTLSRLMSCLERNEMVSRSADGCFRPGLALMRFAHSSAALRELIEAARPQMLALGEATGEKVNLAILEGGAVKQVDQVDCSFLIGGVNWADQPIPLHASALGKVFLAHGTDVPPGRLQRFCSRTITRRQELADDLDRVRRRGWAFAESELEEGLVAIAAPIFGADGRVVAAMSISGPAIRMSASVAHQYAPMLIEAGRQTTRKLGYEPDEGESPQASTASSGAMAESRDSGDASTRSLVTSEGRKGAA